MMENEKRSVSEEGRIVSSAFGEEVCELWLDVDNGVMRYRCFVFE
jgi:hypothetical protein